MSATDSDASRPPPFPFPTAQQAAEDPASLKAPAASTVTKVPEVQIDHGVEETFPASDPVSVSITRLDD